MTAQRPLRDPLLVFLVLSVLAVQLFAVSSERVERLYSATLYPRVSAVFRTLFGWIPFSVGDLLYLAAGAYLLWHLIRGIRAVFSKERRGRFHAKMLLRPAKIALSVYLLFQLLWGLNYSRRDIAGSLDLELQDSDTALLPGLAALLQQRLCTWGDRIDSVRRDRLLQNRTLFDGSVATYERAATKVPFLAYRRPSIKPSLFSPVGHFFGFTGYYNPFTGEAQLHTGIPVFLRPFVVCHEIGHQLGYAKENEANFVGFLSARNSPDPDFVYSAYYEMWAYVLADYGASHPLDAYLLRRTAHSRVRSDRNVYRSYALSKQNAMEPLVMKFYDGYLKLNNQEKGVETYNEVVRWLLAYYKKHGAAGI